MANGIPCKNCGWQDAEHGITIEEGDPDKSREGYQQSLYECALDMGYADGLRHHKDCPGSPECDGDCKKTIAKVMSVSKLNW